MDFTQICMDFAFEIPSQNVRKYSSVHSRSLPLNAGQFFAAPAQVTVPHARMPTNANRRESVDSCESLGVCSFGPQAAGRSCGKAPRGKAHL